MTSAKPTNRALYLSVGSVASRFSRSYRARFQRVGFEYRHQLDFAWALPGGPKSALESLRRLKSPRDLAIKHNALVALLNEGRVVNDEMRPRYDWVGQTRILVEVVNEGRCLAALASETDPIYAKQLSAIMQRGVIDRAALSARLVSKATEEAVRALERLEPPEDLATAHTHQLEALRSVRLATLSRYRAIDAGNVELAETATAALLRSTDAGTRAFFP